MICVELAKRVEILVGFLVILRETSEISVEVAVILEIPVKWEDIGLPLRFSQKIPFYDCLSL